MTILELNNVYVDIAGVEILRASLFTLMRGRWWP